MIICVGPTGAGKTALLKRLQQHLAGEGRTAELTLPRPTVGVNMTKLKVGKKQTIDIREVGGAMAPLWPQQCSGATGLVYVMDASNVMQFSATSVLLLDLLNLESLKSVPFLLVFNKTDANLAVPLDEYKTAMRLSDIVEFAPQQISILQTSCLTGYGMDDVIAWLSKVPSK